MRVALFGASGTIGSRVLGEALARGHDVTAVSRDPSRLTLAGGATAAQADVLDPTRVVEVVRGHDAVVTAIGGAAEGRADVVIAAAGALIAALRDAGIQRLLVVGGAGSLDVEPGVRLVDWSQFPAAWRPASMAQVQALDVYRAADDLDWTYFSPSHEIEPGARTGRYVLGGDQLLRNQDGRSHVSAENFAVAIVDELERGAHLRRRVTVIDA